MASTDELSSSTHRPSPLIGLQRPDVTEKEDITSTREDDRLPALPQTPADPEAGSRLAEQANGSPQSLKTPISQGPAWNASHPCYPHPNPHVPLSSPLIQSTRVIRIPRNYMIAGDLYPAFSNVYPEILAPWVKEVDFRRLIEGLNAQTEHTFNPKGARVWLDGVLSCLTGWLWEDFGLAKSKSGMKQIEQFIESWNDERTKSSQTEERDLVHCIQPRRTGFLSLDIVIPDPKVMVVNEARMKESQIPGNQILTTPSRVVEARA